MDIIIFSMKQYPKPLNLSLRWSELRTRLLLFVLLTILPMFGLVLLSAADERSLAAEDAQEDSLNFTRNAANSYHQEIESARFLLTWMAQVNSVREQDLPTCSALFADLLAQYSQFSNIYSVDMEGNTLCNGRPTTQAINVEGVDWFELVTQARDFSVSNFRIGIQTRLPIVTLAYPIFNDQNEMIGAVGAGLTLAWLNEFIQNIELPEATSINLIDGNQQILARYPPDKFEVGDIYDNKPVVDEVLKHPFGTVQATGIDDIPRLYGYSSLAPQAPNVYLIMSVPEKTAYQDVADIERRNLIGLLAVTILAILIGWFGSGIIVHPVKTLLHAAQRITAGELSARAELSTGIAELQQLAETFNLMADSIEVKVQARTQELFTANQQLKQEIQVREQVEQKLKHSNSELENFAAIASHDLREPLRKVKTFSNRLEIKYTGQLDDEGKDYIHRIQSAIERMQKMIDHLLMYSRIGIQYSKFEQVDLAEIIQEVRGDLETQLESTKGQLEIIGQLPSFQADPFHMYQLFLNLISNALKYHRPNVPPQVRIYSSSNNQICVQDNGIGFDTAEEERIFGLFERLHGRNEYEGTGLGLAICRKIVETYGGSITATSQPGHGSVFTVTMPG